MIERMTIFDRHVGKYAKMLAGGESQEKVARVMIVDERAALAAAEMSPDPGDRAIVEAAVAFGAKELGIAAPRVRFFRSKGFDFGGITYKSHPEEIWVRADLPWFAMGEVALHEVSHSRHFLDGTPVDIREIDAVRFAARGQHLVRSAARAVAQREERGEP